MFTKEHQRLLSKYKQEHTPTYHELLFESYLKELNIKYIKQKGFLSKCHTCLIADFYIPKPYQIIFEIDGLYHDLRKERDIGRDKFFLFEKKISTIRYSNTEVENKEYIINKLKKIFI